MYIQKIDRFLINKISKSDEKAFSELKMPIIPILILLLYTMLSARLFNLWL
jgi:hypothetical protein